VADWAGEAFFETNAGCAYHATSRLELCGKGLFLGGEIMVGIELYGVVMFEEFGIEFVRTDVAARVCSRW